VWFGDRVGIILNSLGQLLGIGLGSLGVTLGGVALGNRCCSFGILVGGHPAACITSHRSTTGRRSTTWERACGWAAAPVWALPGPLGLGTCPACLGPCWAPGPGLGPLPGPGPLACPPCLGSCLRLGPCPVWAPSLPCHRPQGPRHQAGPSRPRPGPRQGPRHRQGPRQGARPEAQGSPRLVSTWGQGVGK